MKNFWEKLNKPLFMLAPMAGYTDQPFRIMCKKFGVDVVYSEMVSSEAIFYNVISTKRKCIKKSITNRSFGYARDDNPLIKTLKLVKFSKIEKPYVVQIFGSNPEHMAYAAEYIASGKWAEDYQKITNNKNQITNKLQYQNFNDRNKSLRFDACDLELTSIPDGIDVNMGCPVRNIVKTGAGAALMKNSKLAVKIIKNIKKQVKNIPISVKTRLGWDSKHNILTFLRKLECAGVDALVIHGRTCKQGFSGKVDWDMIYKIKKELKIPVIGNGGININSNIKIQTSKLDGIMIGRGALGKPWIFRELKIKSEKLKVRESLRDDYINRKKLAKIILEHAELVNKYKGRREFREFRKHLARYFKDLSGGKQLCQQAVRVENMGQIKKLLDKSAHYKIIKLMTDVSSQISR